VNAGLAVAEAVDLGGAFVGGRTGLAVVTCVVVVEGRVRVRLAEVGGGRDDRTEELKAWAVFVVEVEVGPRDGRCMDALTDRRPGVGLVGSIDMHLFCCRLVVGRFTGDTGRGVGRARAILLVPSLLWTLRAEAGREGGPIGL